MSVDRPLLPLYYRVFKTLEQRIGEQQYKPGQRLPSEDELCREFRVSRMTIREAVGRLVDAGLVMRRRGSGTYVGSPRGGRSFKTITFTGSLEDLFAQVEAAQVRSVTLIEKLPPPDVQTIMGLSADEPVSVFRRVRTFDGAPFALTINYLPRHLGSRIAKEDLFRLPLLQLFEQKLGIVFIHADQTVEARVADEDVAHALEVKFGDPVLFIERLMFAKGQPHPVELVRSYYRADVYRYQIRLIRRRRERFAWSPHATPASTRRERATARSKRRAT